MKSTIDRLISVSGLTSIAIIVAITFFLFYNWIPLFETVEPIGFFFGTLWYPTAVPPFYGILPLLDATVWISSLAIFITIPSAFVIAIFITYIVPKKFRYILKTFLEIFSSIPSVILGLIGLSIVAPYFQNVLNMDTGQNILNAAIMLSLITIPMPASMMEDFISAFSPEQKEGSQALGANEFETLTRVVIPGLKGPFASITMLSLGRIFGETMIVLMVAGNAAIFPSNIFQPARVLSSTIAAEMGETPVGTPHFYALFGIGAILFVITFLINVAGEMIRFRYERQMMK
ncbi:phosphate ABC transporter permease subunit PstC [Athalassotoga saccharophila]|uniref:phosphate ABC transporter permease subunit PstC n=1 Tax=Athalassotoga saccharophila TaxID=1441386 RepID=UPI00137B15F0|nr:phosphate ABC transporter permease subunit PstC [Athalassotoga saccharophila]BBJ28107.1 phosphate transport system permease protein PstC [Athalassotoga saccharophila]